MKKKFVVDCMLLALRERQTERRDRSTRTQLDWNPLEGSTFARISAFREGREHSNGA